MNASKHLKKQAKAALKKETVKSLAQALKASKPQAVPKKKPYNKKYGDKGAGGKKDSNKSAGKRKFGETGNDSGKAGKTKTARRERQASKPNFALVENMKKFWNVARAKTLSNSDREELIRSILAKMQGNILQVTLRHDASRAVQCILQFGSVAQRKQVLTEMESRLCEIAKTPYGHFVVLKAITYCIQDTERSAICAALRGHFVALGTNVIGARTAESVLQLLPRKHTRPLKAEFYGHKFIATLPAPPATLKELLESLPNRREPIMDHMRDLIQKFVDKGLLEFAYVHNLIWEYCSECVESPEVCASRLKDLVNLLADSATKLMSTKPGAKTMCVVISTAAAKERKKVMKLLKGHVVESLLHDAAHLAVMRLVDVTDDTVNVQKMVLDEASSTKPVVTYSASGEIVGDSMPPLVSIARHRFGSKLLLRLLAPEKRHLEPDEESLFTQTPLPTSKKSFAARRNEHLAYMRAPLLAICARYVENLVRSAHGSRVLLEVVSAHCPAKVMQRLVALFAHQEVEEEEDDEVMECIDNDDSSDDENEEVVDNDDEDGEEGVESDGEDGEPDEAVDSSGDDSEEESEDEEEQTKLAPVPTLPIEEDPVAQGFLKRVLALQTAAETGAEEKPAAWVSEDGTVYPFATLLVEALLSAGTISTWAERNRTAFALADLLKVPSVQAILVSALKPLRKSIESWSKQNAGGKCLWGTLKPLLKK